MRLLLLIVAMSLFVIGNYSCKERVSDGPLSNDTLVYVMAGQSNMAGRGVVDEAAEGPVGARTPPIEN